MGAVLDPLRGSYSPEQIIQRGSFALGSPATVLRDGTIAGSSKKLFSVTHVSTGLYTVAFAVGLVMPKLPEIIVDIAQNQPPSTPCTAAEVVGSWAYASGVWSFQIQVQTVTTAPAMSDGHAGDRVKFLIIGGITPAGTDPG